MPPATRPPRFASAAYAGLDFIKAAFCPLDFTAGVLGEHPEYRHLKADDALAGIEIGDPLTYTRQFWFTDTNGHRKRGTQVVTAHFGCAPKDFDLFLGLYTYLKRLPELPSDGRTYLTLDFLARQLKLPATCQKDYLRIRSRIFRFSYVKYTNSAFWNAETRSHDIANFGFWNIASLSHMTESRRPVCFEWDRSFLRIAERGTFLAFDYDLYRTLPLALRRLYLIANRDGWNQRDSGVFPADEFTVHQIGYGDGPELARLRLHKLRKLLADAEDLGLVRPFQPWGGYFQTATRGPLKGRLLLRWSRGPMLRARQDEPGRVYTDAIENDALYAQVRELTDDEGKPADPSTFRRLVSRFGRERMQRHVVVVLAQKEYRPGSFQRSELAAYVNRLQHDHPEPDWYQDLKRAERVSVFDGTEPNQLSMDMYEAFFRSQ